jgi:acyl-CoA dehydrogenase
MATEIDAAELLVLKAAWKADEGTAVDEDYAMAKLYATEMLARVTDNALQIFGGMGLMPTSHRAPVRDAASSASGTAPRRSSAISSQELLRPHEG